jgi:hypothetical protein
VSDRPTKEERALPPRKGCESCAHLYGDQAPDPLEQEVDRLRGDLEKLRTIAIETAEHYRTERDEARAALRARDAENEAKAAVIAAADIALEHCRQRPHEHNPAPDWQGPTRCEVIDRALAAIRGSR